MKKIVFVLAVLLCCLAMIPAAAAHGEARTVLTGSADLDAPADACVIRFEVCGYGRTVERADRECEAVLAQVRTRTEGCGSLCEERFYTHESVSGTRICAVRCMLLQTERVGDVRKLIDLLHESGVSAVGEVIGICRDASSYEAEVLRLAVADALARAEAIGADTSHCTVEDCGGFVCGYTPCAADSGVGVRFSCTVRVAFGGERENN